MANPKLVTITVGHLERLLAEFKKRGQINAKTEVWLSSDEEGNSFSPLIQIGDEVQIGTEPDASKITFYPTSM